MATFANMIRRGTRGSQPAASAVAVGTLYFVTDEGRAERSTGAAWESYSGGLVLVESDTASSSATLDFTTWYSSSFDQYLIEIANLVPATDSVDLYMRVSTNGGSSYDTGNNYASSVQVWDNSGDAFAGGTPGSPAGQFVMRGAGEISNVTARGGVCATLMFYNPANTTHYKRIHGSWSYLTFANTFGASESRHVYLSATAVNAFRFLMSSGNIASGTIRVYGVFK